MKKRIVITAVILITAVFSGCSGESHVRQSETTEEEREFGREEQKDVMDKEKSFLPETPDEEEYGHGKEVLTQEKGGKNEGAEYSENQHESVAGTLETDTDVEMETEPDYHGFDYGTESGKASGGEWTQTDEGLMYLMEDGSCARNAWVGLDYADSRGILLLNAMEHIFEKKNNGSAGELLISPSWEYSENGTLNPEEWVGKFLEEDGGRSITVISSDESGITYENVGYGEEGWYTISKNAQWLDGSHCIAYNIYNSSDSYLGEEILTYHGDTVLIHGNEFSNGTYIREAADEIYEPVCGIYTENNLNRFDKNGDKEVAYAYYNEENGNLQITYAVEHIVSDADGYTTYITWQGGYEGPLSEDNHYAIGYKADIISPDEYEFVFTTPECIEVYKNGDYLETLYGYSLYTVY